MFLKAEEMRAWIIIAQSLGIKTMGEAMELFQTLKTLRAHQKA